MTSARFQQFLFALLVVPVLLVLSSIEGVDAAADLLAGYPLDAGSGTIAADVSGHGLTGAVVGATWTSDAKYGSALAFNGSTTYVDLGNPAALQLTGSATWSAWVKASATPADDGQIVAKSDSTSGWQLKTSPDTGPHRFAIGVTGPGNSWVQRNSVTIRQLNTWYHVAGVYDAATATLDIYVNGVLDNGILYGTIPTSQVNSAAPVNIGRRVDHGGYHFAGVIDEVRIYDRALTASEVLADMNEPVGTITPDTLAPTTPGPPAASVVSTSRIDLTWTGSTDNVGVTNYLLERCTGTSCSDFTQINASPATSFSDTSVTASATYRYRVRATDAAANVSVYSTVTSATTPTPDTQAPTAPGLPGTVAGSTQIDLSWSAAADNVAVTGYLIERCAGAGCASFAQIATTASSSFSDTALSSSTTYRYRVRATDGAGNLGAYSPIATATTVAAPTGLVAAFGLNEGSGTTTADVSGSGITGTLLGPTWTTSGRAGNALLFSGGSQYVDLGNSTALRLTGSATWSAWVRASGTPLDDGQIVAKSDSNGGWQFKTTPDTGVQTFAIALYGPATGWVQRNSATVRALNTWYHVAAVYNAAAATLDIYVNGVLDNGILYGVVPTSQVNSSVNANIGRRTGNHGYHFAGTVDEVRVYNRALSASEVVADMNTPVGATPDTTAPTTPGPPALSVISSTQINLTWSAATDNVGVTGYQLERCAGPGCSSFTQIATPAGTSFNDTGLSPSTSYSYRVRATDAAANQSAFSTVTSAATPAPPDTQAPTAPGTPVPSVVSSTQINVTWPAATDNVGVTGYVLERCSGVGCGTFAQVATPSGTSFSDTGLSPSTSYSYRVRAVDAAANAGAYSAVGNATTLDPPDTQAPTAPGAPVPSVVSSTEISLTWPAAADNVGVTGYVLERCSGVGCGTFAQIATPAGTSFSDTGLSPSTSYSYRVRAVDAAANPGAYSAVASATTLDPPDTQAPTAPGTPVPSVVSSTQIDLTWPAATDNVGVTGYLLERCSGVGCGAFAQIATPSGTSFSDSGLSPSTSYGYRVRAVDAAANVSAHSASASATTLDPPDTQAPTAPGTPVPSVVSSTQINLTWPAATDNVAVTGYVLERCSGVGCGAFAQIATPTGTSFSDTGLSPSTSYSYRVRAMDAAANAGAYSATASATTLDPPDTQAPTAPGAPVPSVVSSTEITLSWPAATDNVGVTGYVLERCSGVGCGTFAQIATPSGTSFSDTGLSPSTSYSYRVRAVDAAANVGAYSAVGNATTLDPPDTQAPSAPGAPVPTVVSSTQIDLTWPAATDNVGVTGYVLERCSGVGCGAFVQIATPSGTSFSDTGLSPSTSYSYRVRAVDAAANVSAHSAVASATTLDPPDTQAPTAPGAPVPTVVSSTEITLTWPTATDNVGVTGYLLERCSGVGCGAFAQIATPSGTSFSDTALSPSTSYSYRVRATDAAANAGAYSAVASATTLDPPDTQAPSAPGALVPSVVSSTEISLTWPAATDNVGVTGYLLERCSGVGCGSFAQVATPSGTSFSDTGLSPSSSYSYRVRAVDAAANAGAYSAVASATTLDPPDTQAPSAPGAPVPSVVSSTEISLTWPAATDNVGVTGYVLERCSGVGCGSFAQIATPSGTSFSDTALSPSTSYSYRVRAVDAAANVGAYSAVGNATTLDPPDTQAPGAPGTPVPTVVSSTQINVAWPAATDNVGVTGYVLERCSGVGCGTFAQIATPSGTSFSDTALSPSTSYSYRVRAVDAAANVSAHSASASATTLDPPDTQAPTAPGTPVPSVVSSTQINLTWPAATDNVAVTGYVLERCSGVGCSAFAQIATPSGTSFSDTGLSPSTSYSYRVRAVDAAANVGAYSAVGNATTLDPPDTQAPSAPGAPVPTVVSSTQIDLTWPAATDNVGVTGYVLERCSGVGCGAFAQVATPAGTSFTDTGLSPSTSYSYRVRAVDAAANVSAHSAVASATTLDPPDTQAPTAPGTPVPSVVSSTQIDLTWPAATDNVGVTGYLLERCSGVGCGTFAQIATPSGTSFSDTGLSPSTSYSYRVRAVDAAANAGAYSAVASATTLDPPDTEAPSAPGTPVPTVASSTEINVTWPAATDNVGVTGYVLERCSGVGCSAFAQIATPSGTSFSDTGLSPSTSYSYRVRATDAAANASAYSAVATATTTSPTTGLLAGYAFNEGTGATTADASGSGLTGTLVGPTWTSSGRSGNALLFNGSNQYVDLGNPTALRLTGSATWSAWVRASGNPIDDGQIISKSDSNSGWQFKTSPDTGVQTFAIALFGPATGWVQRNSATVRALNTWYHVAAVYNAPAATLDIYVNGVLDNGIIYGVVPSSQVNSSINVNIGRRTGNHGYHFGGTIDDVRIYNRALSASEIVSDMNTPLGVVVPDTQAPSATGTPVPAVVSSTQINVSWPAATDNVAVTGYRLERCAGVGCATFTQIATPSGTAFSDTGLSPSTSYTYRVRATDAAANLGAYSATASATTLAAPDTTAPTAPGTPAPAVVSSTRIDITWTPATDNVGVTGYLLERCAGVGCATFTQIATPSGTAFSDTGLSPSTSYTYRVRATDAAANLGAYSATASATTLAPPDTTAPTAPGTPAPTVVSSTRIDVTWTPATDNVAVTGYLLERCAGVGCATFTQIATPSGTAFSDTGLAPSTSYTYRVRATDAAANLGAYSATASATTLAAPDTTAPTAPGTPAPTVVSSTRIDVTWTPATDNVAVTGYLLERCAGVGCATFTQIATPSGTAFSDTGLAPSTSYTYRVRATDAAANLGAYSATASATTLAPPDTTAPTAPGTPTPTVVTSTRIDVTWAPATDNVGVTGYLLERCAGVGCATFTQIATPSGTAFSDTGLSPSTSYTYRVRATDAAANLGAYSATASATTLAPPDTTAPTAPGTPAPAVVSSTRIDITWTPATDNVAVTGYLLERCAGVGCATFTQIATPSGTAFSDTGLAPSTSYTYRVRATDAAANLSAYSAAASATTSEPPDTQAPTAPGTPTPAVVSTSQIDLTWGAATDNTGVTGYLLERCSGTGCGTFAQIATPSGTSFSDTGLSPSTSYTYRLRATDAAANLSAYSAAASATTLTPPDAQAPTAPGTPVATVAGSTQINVSWPAATDNVGVTGYLLERCSGAGCSTFSQIATPSGTSFSDTSLSPSASYSYRVRAIDAASNVGPYSSVASATTSSPTTGLLVGYAFNEGSGTAAADASGAGLTGTLVGATWTANGKNGPALVVDGSTQYVDLGNPAALQLTGSATWSAWVRASGNPLDDGQIIAKSDSNSGWQFKTSPDTGPHTFAIALFGPATGWVQRNSATARALDTWYHVAAVYNAPTATLDIYVNGVLDNGIMYGVVPTSQVNAPVNVNIGRRTGNHGYHFGGTIDDVRVYNRALSPIEIQTDMNTPLGVFIPDTTAPTAPGTPVPTVMSSTRIDLTWPAATDNIAVTGYRLERCAGAGCSSFAQIATPSGTSFSDTGLSPATSYTYRVRATDAAANLSGYSNAATAVTFAADTQPPSTPGTPSLLVVSSSQIQVSWTAATDNEAVSGYLLERCQGAGCDSFAQIAAVVGTSFTDTGRTAATSYSYRVRAIDAAGNVGAYSGIASATTAAPGTRRPVFISEAHSATDGCCGLEYNNSTLTLDVTGDDRLLIVAWHAEWDGGPLPAPTAPDPDAWSVTNNGVPGTVITETNGYTGDDGNRRFRIYYWLNPPLGTNTIRVANPNTGPNELSVAAMLFNDVNQADPLGDVVLDVSMLDRTSESETVNTTTSDLVLHVIGDALVTRGTLGPGETEVARANDGQHPWDGDASLWISTKPGTDPTTTVSSSGWASRILNGVAIVLQGSTSGANASVRSSTSHLVDLQDRPFFINGEAAWSLLAEATSEDAELFLENRRQKGVNVLLAMLMPHLYTTNPPANVYGVQPFTTPGDFNTPNEEYFAHVDWVISAADAKGQVVMLAPLYLGYQCEDQGWCAEVRTSSMQTMRNWGRWVGNRYKDVPNIIWVIGGDADSVAHGVQDKVQAFVDGLREFDTTHLMTAHNGRGQSGASLWPNATWLTLNSIYTEKITYEQAANEYVANPSRPAFLIEGHYENEWNSTPLTLRAQAYWAVLSGATSGHVFGNCPIATFSAGPGACGAPGWQNYLDSPGSTTVALVGRLFNSRAFHQLVPDLAHQVVTAGYQSGATYAAAARTADGTTAIVYVPTLRTITFDMTKIAGASARLWWFNPRTGEATWDGDVSTAGSLLITPPDGDDWVLVVDSAALNLPAPGSGPSAP